MTRFLLALFLSLVATPCLSEKGAAIYAGGQVTLENEGAARQLSRFPCHSCHGRDARGGIEGDVPPIDWVTLSEKRPAYDLDSFHRAVTEGVSSDGRAMSRLMPRFEFSRAETDALAQHLRQIQALQRRGVATDTITVGVASLGEVTEAYVDTLRTTLRSRLGGDRVHGRRVKFVIVARGEVAAYDDLLVLLGAPAADIAAAVARGLPILAPFGPLDGNEDPTIVRAITPSRDRLLEALAEDVAQASDQGSIAILSQDDALTEDMAVALRFAASAMADRIGPAADATDVILLGGAPLATGMVPRRVWLDQHGARQIGRLPEDAEIRILLDAPDIAMRAARSGRSPILVHAELAATVLAEALKVAGRDLTRAALFGAIDDTVLRDIGLDYRMAPLTGTIQVPVMSIR